MNGVGSWSPVQALDALKIKVYATRDNVDVKDNMGMTFYAYILFDKYLSCSSI